MGAFFTNISLKTNDLASVKTAITGKPAFVSSNQSWVTLYLQETEDQNTENLRTMTKNYSTLFKCPAIAFLVHDSDNLSFYYYKNGEFIDAYVSFELFIEEESNDIKQRIAENNHDTYLKEIVKESTTEGEINRILSAKHIFAEEKLEDLLKLLEIGTVKPIGYNYLVKEIQDHPDIQPLS